MTASLALAPSAYRPKLFSSGLNQRILCLIVKSRNNQRKNEASICEALLRFSPRVQCRGSHLFFVDVKSTASLLGGESCLIESATDLLKNLGFHVQAAISDTPSGAQALASSLACSSESHLICHPGEERETLQHLSLPLLLHLQGLKEWSHTKTVEQMISFFQILGFNTLGDLHDFSLMAFKERWGEIGVQVWQRIQSRDEQIISPFLALEPLQEYTYLDFPLSVLSLLLHYTRQTAEVLFARLQGRRIFAQKLILNLRCEYSEAKYKIEVEPQTPSRDLDLFLTLLTQKLESLDLENPIRDFEIEVIPCTEKVRQLDFFEPRTTDHDRLEKLLCVLSQADIKSGLFSIQNTILPEKSWQLTHDSQLSQTELTINKAPRPTRLLKHAQMINEAELANIRLLSRNPLERLESSWWSKEEATQRDYYFAIHKTGSCLWVYKDLKNSRYFLHGYFD